MGFSAQLPHLNASLNAVATLLLLAGFWLIRRRWELAHRRVMLSCFVVSLLFLISYLLYHAQVGSTRFPLYPPFAVRFVYRLILFSHIVLAATVPVLALVTILLAWRDRRAAHRRVARWTFPIWLYVSVTGMIVYLMLHQLYPPQTEATIISRQGRAQKTISAIVLRPSQLPRADEAPAGESCL